MEIYSYDTLLYPCHSVIFYKYSEHHSFRPNISGYLIVAYMECSILTRHICNYYKYYEIYNCNRWNVFISIKELMVPWLWSGLASGPMESHSYLLKHLSIKGLPSKRFDHWTKTFRIFVYVTKMDARRVWRAYFISVRTPTSWHNTINLSHATSFFRRYHTTVMETRVLPAAFLNRALFLSHAAECSIGFRV